MLDRLGRRKPQLDQLQLDAALIRKAGSLLEMAAKFQAIYQSQVSLAQRFDKIHREIARGNDQNRRMLPLLADTQQKNREALDAFATELKKRAEALDDPALVPLRDSALAFVEALAMSDPGSVMDLAIDAGRNGRAGDAFANAELARALLEQLMQKQDDAFCQACQGQCMKFSITHPDVQQTMRQPSPQVARRRQRHRADRPPARVLVVDGAQGDRRRHPAQSGAARSTCSDAATSSLTTDPGLGSVSKLSNLAQRCAGCRPTTSPS